MKLRPLPPAILVPDRTPQRGTRASDAAVLAERAELIEALRRAVRQDRRFEREDAK